MFEKHLKGVENTIIKGIKDEIRFDIWAAASIKKVFDHLKLDYPKDHSKI